MKWYDLVLEGSYVFDEHALAPEERRIWRAFPADLRRVLRRCNGGRVREAPRFSTGIEYTHPDGRETRGACNWMTSLSAFLPLRERVRRAGIRSIVREHVDRHVAEDFLPSGVYVFGECDQGCLVAVSTNAADHGAAERPYQRTTGGREHGAGAMAL